MGSSRPDGVIKRSKLQEEIQLFSTNKGQSGHNPIREVGPMLSASAGPTSLEPTQGGGADQHHLISTSVLPWANTSSSVGSRALAQGRDGSPLRQPNQAGARVLLGGGREGGRFWVGGGQAGPQFGLRGLLSLTPAI